MAQAAVNMGFPSPPLSPRYEQPWGAIPQAYLVFGFCHEIAYKTAN